MPFKEVKVVSMQRELRYVLRQISLDVARETLPCGQVVLSLCHGHGPPFPNAHSLELVFEIGLVLLVGTSGLARPLRIGSVRGSHQGIVL